MVSLTKPVKEMPYFYSKDEQTTKKIDHILCEA